MEITASSRDNVTALQLEGRMDLNSSSQLKKRVKDYLGQGKTSIILDLSDVNFINSSGLGTLVSILKDVRMVKGRMVLCNLAQYVQEVFEITQLSHIFEIYPTAEEATASFADSVVNAR
jgi:anti-sigma B factor antagonist